MRKPEPPASSLGGRLAQVTVLVSMLASTSTQGRIMEQLTTGSLYYASDTLRSSNGVFEFGLVSPRLSRSMYLGIWYSGIEPTTIVWVANRNYAISRGEGISFALDLSGQLSIRDQRGMKIWNSYYELSGAAAVTTRAVLLNSGDLVLESVEGKYVWRSFEHPGNTWLPYMKLGLDTSLTSWASSADPTQGSFSLRMLPTMELACLWDNQWLYWSSGPWDGKGFHRVPQMISTTFYNFSLDNNRSFTWRPYNATDTRSHFLLGSDGTVKQVSWWPSIGGWAPFGAEPESLCDPHTICGSFAVCEAAALPPCSCPLGFYAGYPTDSSSQGCYRNGTLDCTTDEFTRLNRTTFNSVSLPTPALAMDLPTCLDACKSNCYCIGFYFDVVAFNCSLFRDTLINGRVSADTAGDFYLKVPAGTHKGSVNSKQMSKLLFVGAMIAIPAVLLVILVAVAIVLGRQGRQKRRRSSPTPLIPGLLAMFPYWELERATKNFTESLGSGGFGFVFKGCLHDGTAVGVKQLNWVQQGDKQFRVEVRTIGNIQHVNLIRLIGFTCEGKHRLLAYEYMPNGSLDRWLFHKKETIDWASRYRIALGIARGMRYLHKECRHQIIHCDIKPENILLDAQFNAKVSDFGLAKILGKEFSRVMTTPRGTRGYLAPEWLAGLPLTPKVDVYSYGMTLLEIISGRRNLVHPKENDILNDEDGKNKVTFFPIWAIEQMMKGNLLSLVDDRIQGAVDTDQLCKASYVAGWCIQDDEELRPSMKNVVDMLEGNINVNGPPPIPSSLKLFASINDEED